MSTTVLPLALGRFKLLPQRSNEVWQGGLVALPAWIDNPDDPAGRPYRPVGALWVSLRTGLLHLEMPDRGESATPAFALKALVDFGLKESKRLNGRPSTVEITDAQLMQTLSGALAPLNTVVMQVDEIPAVAEALRHLEMAAGGGHRHAGMLEDTGVTVDQLRAFADAAATFFRAEPWRHLTNEDLIVVEAPAIPKAMRHVCVLGNAGEQFGIAFFDSRRAFERIYTSPGMSLPRRAFSVTYGPVDELPFADGDAWQDLALPVAGPRAYPLASDLGRDGTMRRLNATELRAAEGLLRTLAQTTEEQLDAGSWNSVVPTFGGAMELALALPFLLESEQGKPVRPPLGMMPRIAERASVRVARLFETQSFENLDEANAALEHAEREGLLDADPEAAAGRALTALERAQEVAYDAMEATGRLKTKLARRALKISPDCADACVILGEASATPQDARDWYARGVEAGARAIGADQFAALRGEFWEHLETRPYMRARLALANVLRRLGQESEAVEHYREMLRLNPNDNQGVRYPLATSLLELGRGDEVDGLLREYEGDIQAIWPYAWALRAFQVAGDDEGARERLATAVRANPHGMQYLLDPDAIPRERPPHFALGSREEGAYVADALEAAFNATPGAREWLRVMNRRIGSRRARRRRAPR